MARLTVPAETACSDMSSLTVGSGEPGGQLAVFNGGAEGGGQFLVGIARGAAGGSGRG
jgi:hypothetical protein